MSAPAVRKEKICIECKNDFVPTGNCQKRCPDCRAKNDMLPKTATVRAPLQFGKKVKQIDATRHVPALTPSLTVACTMQDTVAIFHALADAGCTCLVFGNTKITIETV